MTRTVTKVLLNHGAVFVSDGKKREWVCEIPAFFTSFEQQEIHKKLDSLGFSNYDNRHTVIEALKDYFEKNKKKQFKIEDGAKLFSDKLKIAEAFLEIQPLYYDERKLWWIWNFKIKSWEIVDEIDILNALNSSLDLPLFESKLKTEILNALQMKARLNKPQEAKKTWLQFKGKIVDIKTGEIFDASSLYFITNPIPWEIGETDETPEMDKVFEEWVGKENVPLLYEIAAFCLALEYFLARVFCLHGPGSNGKSKFLELLRKFLGEQNTTSTELDLICTGRFETAKLFHKLLCTMGETNFARIKKSNMLKRLSGDDVVPIEFKGKQPFDFKNYAKILIATNSLPTTDDKTKGYYRRWLIIDFPNEFTEKSDVLGRIPEQEYSALAKKSIKILSDLLGKREFTNEGTIEDRARRYEEKSDPLARFIRETCVVDADKKIPFFEFYDCFVDYLKNKRLRILSKREVSILMHSEGFETKVMRVKKQDGSETTWRFFLGLNFIGREAVTDVTDDTHISIDSLYRKGVEYSDTIVTSVTKNKIEQEISPISLNNTPNEQNNEIKEKESNTIKIEKKETKFECCICRGKAGYITPDGRLLCSSCYVNEKELEQGK